MFIAHHTALGYWICC